MPCFRSPFPFAFQQQSASSFISRHRIIPLSPSKGQHGFSTTSYSNSRGVGKDPKLPTFTDAEEGGTEGRNGINFPFLKKTGETKEANEKITTTLFIADDNRSHGQTALMAILVS